MFRAREDNICFAVLYNIGHVIADSLRSLVELLAPRYGKAGVNNLGGKVSPIEGSGVYG